jgi:site-specific DNA-methyltransferase (adenine-specific)
MPEVQPVTLFEGDCLAVMGLLPDASIDAIVTDPPYGLGFMGKDWDDLPPGLPWARECLRVLKPGGHLLAFGGTRTWHRLAVAVEDAGFEIRDSIAWLYGSGFPKSMDVSKAIDKAAGATREVIGAYVMPADSTAAGYDPGNKASGWKNVPNQTDGPSRPITAPATPEAEQWQGWGTALKPAFEPIVVARKPIRGTVAANVLEHGTGAINVDGCRVEAAPGDYAHPGNDNRSQTDMYSRFDREGRQAPPNPAGRWPANVILDEDQAAALDEQSGTLTSGAHKASHGRSTVGGNGRTHGAMDGVTGPENEANTGGASRFFYVAKAPKKERPTVDGVAHPTVKPLALMRWLCRLVTPPGGFVLDPFAGSGTTGEAAALEGFKAILIEREADYHPLIQARIDRLAAAKEAS